MCVNNVGYHTLSLNGQVWNIKKYQSWETSCQQCGTNLESESKLCDGWYCKNPGTGIWLKRDGESCPQWEGNCVNARDNTAGENSCAYQVVKTGTKCAEHYGWKDCDQYCGLCPCSTGSGTTKEHCSGHGTCVAQCRDDKRCSDAYCECEDMWTGSKCDTAVSTTTTTTVFVVCNEREVSSCSQCSEADCTGQDCFWNSDAEECVTRVDCGLTLASSCSACGDRYSCHGECYWDANANSCKDPLDPSLKKSCGATHRADTCGECMVVFARIDPAWGNHAPAGCRGDCVYNQYFGNCQDVPVTQPTDLHPSCPANLTACAGHIAASNDPSSDTYKMVSGIYQLSFGVLLWGSEYQSAYGEDYWGKKTVKKGVFRLKSLGHLANIAGRVYQALTPQPTEPCSGIYDEDEFFLCIWNGIMPYVEQYVSNELEDLETSNYEARTMSVLTRLKELKAFVQNSLNTSDLDNVVASEEFATSSWVNVTRNQTLALLVNLDSYMRNTGGFLLKDDAPFSQVVYLNFWAQLHTYIMFSLLTLAPETYQTDAYVLQFATSMSNYSLEIERRGLIARTERAGQIELDRTECDQPEVGSCTVPSRCSDCTKSAVLKDNYPKCDFQSGTLNIGKCHDPSVACASSLSKQGTCDGTYEECETGARLCEAAYRNGVLFNADSTWFDFAVAHISTLRNSAFRLSGHWPGTHRIASISSAGAVEASWGTDAEKAARALCCEKECTPEGSTMCPDTCSNDSMTYAEAASFCEDRGRQLCSVYELEQRRCEACKPGTVWTRSTSPKKLFASQEPCMQGAGQKILRKSRQGGLDLWKRLGRPRLARPAAPRRGA